MKKNNLFEIGSSLDQNSSQEEASFKKMSSQEILPPSKHSLYFQREKRRGKVVTLVGELFLSKDEVTALLSHLKKTLGVGGSYKDGFIELQGEVSSRAKEILLKKEFRFKK